MEMSVVGNFQAELVPREIRGFAVGSYQMAIVRSLHLAARHTADLQGLGGIIIGVVCNFTRNIGVDDGRDINLQWRIPMALYFVIPTIVACGTWFMPESPRWLASKGRIDEARDVLRRVRVNNSPEAIAAELGTIQTALASLQSGGSYADLFRGANRKSHLQVPGEVSLMDRTTHNDRMGRQYLCSIYGPILRLELWCSLLPQYRRIQPFCPDCQHFCVSPHSLPAIPSESLREADVQAHDDRRLDLDVHTRGIRSA